MTVELEINSTITRKSLKHALKRPDLIIWPDKTIFFNVSKQTKSETKHVVC